MIQNKLFVSMLAVGLLLTTPALAADQVVKMTTAKSVGETITLLVNQVSAGVTVDWGDGTTVAYAATDDDLLTIEGTVQGSEITLTAGSKLTTLVCAGNELTALDVSEATNLRSLYCQNNQLTELDIAALSKLTDLNVADNQISGLVIKASTQPLLENLNIAGNGLKNVNGGSSSTFVLSLSTLQQLNVTDNEMTALNLTGNTALDVLKCAGNSLTKLNLAKNSEISVIVAHDNAITAITMPTSTGAPNLRQVFVDNNSLSTLDLSESTSLSTLSCENNELTSVSLPTSTQLYSMACGGNNLTFASLPGSSNMPTYINYTPQESEIDITSVLKKKSGIYYIPVATWSDRTDEDYLLDLTDQAYDADGKKTITFTWWGNNTGEDPAELTKATALNKTNDYFPLTGSSTYGMFSFFNEYDEVYCILTSDVYTDLEFKTTTFAVSDPSTVGIAAVKTTKAGLNIAAGKRQITLSAQDDTPVNIYSTNGKLVWKGTVNSSATTIDLPSGVYVVGGQKVVL